MKSRILLSFALLFGAVTLHAQTDNTVYARMFRGNTVGAKVTAAQLTCGTNPVVPCLIVIDPSLAAYATGVLPTLCSHCFLVDFRNGWPGGGGGGSGFLPLTAGATFPLSGVLYGIGTSFTGTMGAADTSITGTDTAQHGQFNADMNVGNSSATGVFITSSGILLYGNTSPAPALLFNGTPGAAGFDVQATGQIEVNNGVRGNAGGLLNAAGYKVAGNPFATKNLADWDNSSASVGSVPNCAHVTSGSCDSWTMGAAASGYLPLAGGALTGIVTSTSEIDLIGTGSHPPTVSLKNTGPVFASTLGIPPGLIFDGFNGSSPFEFQFLPTTNGFKATGSGGIGYAPINASEYLVAGTQIATANLGDWSNSGAIANYIATCTATLGGNCTNWAPRPAPGGTINNAPQYELYYQSGAGSSNVASGAGIPITPGTNNNVIVGQTVAGMTGLNNAGIGAAALANLTTGNGNTAIGYAAGSSMGSGALTSASSSIFVGDATRALSNGDTNEGVFCFNCTGAGSNTYTFGNAAVTDEYFGGSTGLATIHVGSCVGCGGSTVTAATPYIAIGSQSYDSNFTPVVKTSGTAFSNMDVAGELVDGSGNSNYTLADSTGKLVGTYPGVTATNGDIEIVGGYNNETDMHWMTPVSGKISNTMNASVLSVGTGGHSANIGPMFCDTVNHVMGWVGMYGNNVGPAQAYVTLWKSDWNSSVFHQTECAANYPQGSGGFWGNFNHPTDPTPGPIIVAAPLDTQYIDPSNLYFRWVYHPTTVPGPISGSWGTGTITGPGYTYEYSRDGLHWAEMGTVCASGCAINTTVGAPTHFGWRFHGGNRSGWYGTSIGDIKSLDIE